ncbi:hypothetical protein [Bradyrhizobium sp. WSM1253]|uniref:hypothetical protein n=1 Tax=Bradyrhizobium sp. WSM1253 TaxID=319003 RepID=UPI001FDA4011|nr:hypothetical protein [Bradyrhizobium sp. WSM1253]
MGVLACGAAMDFGARGALGFETLGFGGAATGAGVAVTAGAATLAVLAIFFAGALVFAEALFFSEALAGFLVAVFTGFFTRTCFFAAFFAVFAALFFPVFLAAVFLVFVAFLTFLAALRVRAFTAFFAAFLTAFVAAFFLLLLPLAVFLARAATTNSFTGFSKFGNEPALVYRLEHGPIGKPLHSFPDHALARRVRQPAEHRENQGLSLQIVGFGVARGADDLFPYLS